MAFIFLRLLVLGVIAAAAGDVQITWLTPPRGVVSCVVADEGRAQRRPPPPLDADDHPRSRVPRRLGGERVEVLRQRNGTEGVYQCSVAHQKGIVLGYPVHWKFASMHDQFTRHPENSTVSAGTPHVLTCEIPSSPPATVSWLRNGESLSKTERYIFLNTQLVFTEVRKEDAGVYKCKVTNKYLNKTRSSRAAWLKVVDPVDSEPGILPLQDEVNILAPRFSRVQLLCPVVGWPRPKITWEFTSPGSRTAILESVDEVLVLTSLEFDLEGVYRCTIDDYSHLIKVFSVTISEPVVITVPPVSKEVIRAGTVRFNCSASGKPAPTITWYKDGKLIHMGGRFNMRSSQSGNRYQMVVGGVTSADAGIYQCFASNNISMQSSWAVLSVTGEHTAAPPTIRCWPLGYAVLLRWAQPTADVMAYTVQTTLPVWPGTPHNNTEEIIPVTDPLTTYSFQVRAFIRGPGKNVATDMSDAVQCQGQGVPVHILKQNEEKIIVSWKDFAENTQGVAQWILQYRPVNSTEEHNITLPGEVFNYTLHVSPKESIEVRLLGSMSEDWLQQNLTLLPWTLASEQNDVGKTTMIPFDVRVSQIKQREFTVRWRHEGAETTFNVCVKTFDGARKCLESVNNTIIVDGLEPDTEYLVEVAAMSAGHKPGPSSIPVLITTALDGPDFFNNLAWKFVNSTTVRVSWNAPPGKYIVQYSSELNVPVDFWDTIETVTNTVLINNIDTTKDTFVMVSGYDPLVYSTVKTIPAQVPVSGVEWWWTPRGVGVRWEGEGRVLRYSQNLTRSVEHWPALEVPGTTVELTNLDPSLPTYVMVATLTGKRNEVFNIPVRPAESSSLYVGLGIGAGVFLACLLAVAAVCLWRRRKGTGTPLRLRRRNVSSNEEEDEEAAEMKSVGGRLANGGGSKDAGEPLLNGHVHITENPQSKTPNGKLNKVIVPFDLSRYEEPDATLETVLDDRSVSYDLLDTSRRPDVDDQVQDNSFPKLPDDNMNSELNTSGFYLDNSKIQPTLQPNG